VTRHAYVREHEDTGLQGIRADSTEDEILAYTSQQSAKPRIFPEVPARIGSFAAISPSGAGADLLAVSRAMGYARPSITFGRYGHLAPAGLVRLMARIDVVALLRQAA